MLMMTMMIAIYYSLLYRRLCVAVVVGVVAFSLKDV
jgi:hypothetical protein